MTNSIPPMERNIEAFNADAAAHGGYVYTAVDSWSSRCASEKQTEQLIQMLATNFPTSVRIVDIGCGDGAFTMEMVERFGPASIRGIDPAANAVEVAHARLTTKSSASVSFEVGSIYDLESKGETLAVARGVLHHLDRPQDAIIQLTRQFTSVLALEPNGYSPIMKIIEKASRYHREHDEKSYWPPTLTHWFEREGFKVVAQRFFGLVPYFCPTLPAKILSRVGSVIESVPVARELCCGTNLVLYRRMS
jgi:SAM-dependent methyltransferase